MKKIKIAVLISGRGSNLKALIDACKHKHFPAEIGIVISNKKDAPGLTIAEDNNIHSAFMDHRLFDSREEFDKELNKTLVDVDCELICLAGFMRILTPGFINSWKKKIINIHPSLLPEFKGMNPVEDALKSGAKYSGCTVHYVIPEVDSGEIIEQARVEILENDTKEILANRILEQEHIIYPIALQKVCKTLYES